MNEVREGALRTPEERFESLPGFAWAPNYLDDLAGYEGLRAHYVDAGPTDAEVFLCLHGEPTWAYLYRRMIPVFTAAGARAVAPDFFGFGRSDKPIDDADYTFGFHRNYLLRLIERLDLRRITLVCQDWGGLLGLTLPLDMPERFERLIVMNTTLGTGEGLNEGFLAWRAYMAKNPDLAVDNLMQRSCPHISAAEAAAYAAPWPDQAHKAGVRRFPQMVPENPGDEGAEISRRARDWWRSVWTGKAFMAVGIQDPVLGPPIMSELCRNIKNCPEPFEVAEAGHFVQEWGEEVATAALAAFA
ncbi:MAG: haloalkane dehalogenase [Alphaproteobacteria bacterium]|jgi:pimeloyl-ACP methyl ester carboxylesterase|nr:haloalkane dehalogenase [Alphaproteobacteria bacterium]MDP6621442.1 haloalkane dehalogenase [Alphaproteobacteria bacterium]|tara:strand:- start:337 stop:1239 length:903 start_codon:yes stop_codon:yes gene_type:complete